MARITVMAAGKPSGIEATATATDVVNISIKPPPVIRPSTKIAKQTREIIKPIVFEKRASFF